MNGSRSGRCSRPRTRRPMKKVIKGRSPSAKKATWAASRTLMSIVEVTDQVKEDRAGVAEGVHSVQHAAVAWNEFTEVFDAEVAFDRAHHRAARKTRDGQQQGHANGLQRRKRSQKAHHQARNRSGDDSSQEPFPGFVRTDCGKDFVAAQRLAPNELEHVAHFYH